MAAGRPSSRPAGGGRSSGRGSGIVWENNLQGGSQVSRRPESPELSATASAAASADRHAGYDANRLFLLSCVSLVAAAFAFTIRGAVQPELVAAFAMSNETVNSAMGAAFLGFALTVFVGSPACDWVGMGRLLQLAGIFHLVGTLGTIFAQQIGGAIGVYNALWGSMFVVGLAHGLVEAVINPLAATMYPEEKTHKLNVLHAWWPGGIVIGGLIASAMAGMGANWQLKLGVILLPAILYLVLLVGQRFPSTERVASGVSTGEMVTSAFNPLFLAFLFCMLLTASAELGPNQLFETLSKTV
ncbi:MAG: MFS transporter, partial [Armatimonadetes bacterium]|nr:MFS transporter [Armatimonadota bacterium]